MKTDPHQVFEEYLSKEGGRYTKTKQFIASEIFDLSEHFEVESFIDHLRVKTKDISRATVYRLIKQLLDAGLLQKISTRDGKVYYEQSRPQKEHAHIICNDCGKIIEIHDKSIRDLLVEQSKKLNFKATYQSVHIYGECQIKEHCPNLQKSSF